jgi:flagellar hook-associated protein 2
MATTSATSSASSSGIDVNGLVTSLMTVERQPITKLDAKTTNYNSQLTALGLIKSKVATLQTAAQALGSTSSSSLLGFSATSSDSTVFSATTSSTAVAGIYSLSVTSLAQSQKLVALGQTSSTTAIGTGTPTTVTFDLGTISGGTLTNGVYTGASFASNGSAKTISIDSSNNTLEGIRDTINAAGLGVSASIVNDGSGTPYRLALSSNATGANSSLKISTDGADAGITGLLAHDPAGTQSLSETVSAKNAAFSVNGIAISKASNSVTDVIQGVTLTLNKVTTTPVTLTLARDTTAVTTAVNSFVTAYNDLNSSIRNSVAYKSGSALAGDSTLRALQSQMREIAVTAAGSGTLTMLSEIGVTSKADGTLQVDGAKLSSALSTNFSDVANLFNSATGYATRINNWSTSALAYDGTFANRTSGINQYLKSIADQRAALETRMTSLEKNYTRQFTSLNMTLVSMSQTSTYLTQQLAKL